MISSKLDALSTAVLIPCYNEELTIAKVVTDFRAALPRAAILVFDNNSSDRSAEMARMAGATVIPSPRQGKGNVVRHAFEVVDAEVYVMVDGDDTYPASAALQMIEQLVLTGSDMVVGARISDHEAGSFRRFHKIGNKLITGVIRRLFRVRVTDVLSGYRAFSRSLVKSLPLVSEGFDIETELTLQAATKGFMIREVPIRYGQRPPGSESKLSTYADGFLILRAISTIFKDYKPMFFFTAVAGAFAVLALLAGFPPILDYARHAYVYRVPLAILAAAFGILSVLFFGIGLILDSAVKYHRENFELWRRQLGNLGNVNKPRSEIHLASEISRAGEQGLA